MGLAVVAAALTVTSGPARAGSQDCFSYAYDCTPGYNADNAQGTWAWSYYGDIANNDITDRNGRNHNCTLYVAWRLAQSGMGSPGRSWGNAIDWAGAIGGGNHTPAVGSIAWYGTGQYGHVAYVEQVSGGNVFIRADNYSTTQGYTDAGWVAASSVGLFLHPHDVAAGGRQPDGTLIRTPAGDIFRVVGGAPLHLASCEPFNGCAGYVSVPDLSAYLPVPINGVTISAAETGRVYKMAGGAPLYLNSCDAGCGTPTAVNQWTIDVLDHLRSVPADGTTLATPSSDTGRVYKVAGGAPLYLNSCDADCGAPVTVNQFTIDSLDHLRAVPADGTTIATPSSDTGRIYKIAGGYPMWLGSCDVGCGNPVTVNQFTIDSRNHLSAVVADGTFVRIGSGTGAGTVARAAGGALLPLSTCDPVGGCAGYVDVNDGTFQSYVDGHPHPVDGTVVAGTPSGRLLTFAGGCASPVTDGAPVTTIDDGGFDWIGRCLSISSTTLAAAVWKTAYSTTLAAAGGNGSLSWSVVSGHLPGGLSLASSGVLAGTPAAAGTYRFTVRVSDSASPVHSATQTMTVKVAAIAVATSSLPGGVVGKPVSTTLTASGGAGEKTWAVSSGTLPAGLTLSGAGRLSGTTTVAGTYRFAVTVTDSATPANTASKTMQLVVAPIGVRTATLKAGTVGRAYTQTLLAWGGTAPLRWTLTSGALPPGMTLSAAGVVSGTPTAAGSYEVTVRVADAARKSASATFTVVVS